MDNPNQNQNKNQSSQSTQSSQGNQSNQGNQNAQGNAAAGTSNSAAQGASGAAAATNAPNAPNASNTSTTGADDMLTLMEQSSKTCTLGQWMKCMRKPALSLRYTLDKRHIADMDSETAGGDGSPDPNKASAPIKGANADVMSVKGGLTIRYFDLAAGMLTLLVAGCLIKGCCCLKKMM